MLKFKLLSGDATEGKFVSKRINHGDFDFWIVMEVFNWIDAIGEKEAPATYHAEVSIVAPSEVGEEDKQRALESWGLEKEQVTDPLQWVDLIHSYGVRATLWQGDGNNLRKLLKEAHKEAFWRGEGPLFGFTMDSPQNAIGTTGWEMVKGDLLAPLKR